VAIAAAEQDGAMAAALVANALGAGEAQDRAAVSIVQRWAQFSPQEAAAWVAQFPDIPSREPAVHNLVMIWTSQKPLDAAAWLESLPKGALRNIGLNAHNQASTPMSE
ncbi:MAG: hypothetical protein IH623_04315, partial [Verrucomicrobia bacterium]|nr:hypothetical protein [Verrucomicrobiota bacterium]